MSINPAFRGHGVFTYLPEDTMRYYANYPASMGHGPSLFERMKGIFWRSERAAAASPDGFVRAVKDMNMSHVWVRLFGLEGAMPEAPTRTLITALKAANINVAGWGYCHGRDWRGELSTALSTMRAQGLTAFVADIEPGRLLGGTKSKWAIEDFKSFVDGLTSALGKDNVGISTWPVLKIQNDPEYPSMRLMQAVADKVAMFAPQAYWMKYPTTVHYQATGFTESEFPRNDPESFVRLVVASWRRTGFNRPLVVTGQAYWGEGAPPQAEIERKLETFTRTYSEWSNITAINWWHAGGSLAMSRAMQDSLKAARLNDKPYAAAGHIV